MIAGSSHCWLLLIKNEKEKKKQTGLLGASRPAKEISTDAAVTAVSSEFDGIFTLI